MGPRVNINDFKTKVFFSYFRTHPLLPLLKRIKEIHGISVHILQIHVDLRLKSVQDLT